MRNTRRPNDEVERHCVSTVVSKDVPFEMRKRYPTKKLCSPLNHPSPPSPFLVEIGNLKGGTGSSSYKRNVLKRVSGAALRERERERFPFALAFNPGHHR